MAKYILKDALVAEIEKRLHEYEKEYEELARYGIWITAKKIEPKIEELKNLLSLLDTLEVIDPCEQYSSVEGAIQAHAKTYSFNIESRLFPQLTKEQQKLWKKEIEEAYINGSDAGYSLAGDNDKKDVNLEKEIKDTCRGYRINESHEQELGERDIENIAHYFYELGLKAQKGKIMKTGIELITEERQRQIEVEGYSLQHDSQHDLSEFLYAAIAYAEAAKVDALNMELSESIGENAIKIRKIEIGRGTYPWGISNWKPTTCLRDLVKAGALIAAAIDRLQARKE